MGYDSREETLKHSYVVSDLVDAFVTVLSGNALVHDASKLKDPEKKAFDEATPKLKGLTYGSDEYRAELRKIEEAVKHHYSVNRHHPEHFEDGVDAMTLMDVVEMLADWKAASLRHDTGDIMRSIEVNRVRFNLSDQLCYILINTVRELEWDR